MSTDNTQGSHDDEAQDADWEEVVEPGKRMGRPVVEWGEFEIRVVRALASVMSKRQIAFHMGISYPTYLAIERRQPEVAQAFNQGKAMAIAGVAAGILNRALQGSIKDAHFYMRTQGGWNEDGANMLDDTEEEVDEIKLVPVKPRTLEDASKSETLDGEKVSNGSSAS